MNSRDGRDLLTRQMMSEQVARRLHECAPDLKRQWQESQPINYFVLDDVLPPEWAGAIRTAFPDPGGMTLKRSLRELKYIAAQMDRYDPLLEEAIYTFQAPAIVSTIEQITGL